MAINPVSSSLSSAKRLTGLVSGLDTDSLVKQMILAQQTRLNKATQQKQLIEWQRTAYSSVVSRINSFQSKHLDVLNPNSILRTSAFKTSVAKVQAGMEKYVSVSAATDSVPSSLKISEIRQLAMSQTITSSNTLSKAMTATFNATTIEAALNSGGSAQLNGTFAIILDGVKKNVSLDSIGLDISDYATSVSGEFYVANTATGMPVLVAAGEHQGKRIFSDGTDYYIKQNDGTTVTLTSADFTFDPITQSAVEMQEIDLVALLDDVVLGLNAQLTTQFGSGKLAFASTSTGLTLNVLQGGSQALMSASGLSGGISVVSGQSSYVDTNKSIGDLFSGLQMGALDTTKTPQALFGNSIRTSGGELNFTVTYKTGSVTNTKIVSVTGVTGTTSLDDILSSVNSQLAGVATLEYSDTTGKFSFAPDSGISITGHTDTNNTNFLGTVLGYEGKVNFKINDVEFKFSPNVSLKDIMNSINSSDAGVRVSYSSLTDKLIFTATETGSGNKIVLEDLAGSNFFDKVLGGTGVIEYGRDAELTVDGVDLFRSTNTFTIDGVVITLNEETPAGFTGGIQITGGVDTQLATDNIKEFINSYNELMQFLNGLVNEPKQRGYLPLTSEQKSDMTEKQIEDWDKMAKSGLLKGDTNILKMINELRTAVVSAVSSKSGSGGVSLASIGITLSDKRDGTLVINDEKLAAALERDPEALAKLFTQLSDVSQGQTLTKANTEHYVNLYQTQTGKTVRKDQVGNYIFSQSDLNSLRFSTLGIGQKFSEIVNRAVNPSPAQASRGYLVRIAGTNGNNSYLDYESSLNAKIRELDVRINSLQRRVYDAEDKAYIRLAKLEKALSTMNSQSSYLFSQQ